jgi:glycosyltransferase involved in cell wall biosynthesis
VASDTEREPRPPAAVGSRDREATICLSMIVKNEEHVVRRALASVRDFVDYWVVCDTGSSDQTPAAVLSAMAGVPGELHRTEWLDFGQSRTEAIRLARGKADYILVLDADMVANVRGDFKAGLHADAYEIRYEGSIDYTQRMLLADQHDWQFVGATHEFVSADTERTREPLPQLTLTHVGDGGSRADKFERDLRLLRSAVEREPENPRHTFYLAQTYRDLGRPAEALECYRRRAALEQGWEEERWYAMYQVGRLQQELGEPWPAVLDSYLKAYAARPTRIEPIYQIVKHYRTADEFGIGELFAARHLPAPPYPDDNLFIEREVYDHGFLLEAAICLVGAGRTPAGIDAFNRLLDHGDLPDWVADAAIRGRKLALDVLHPRRTPAEPRANRMKVIVPFHNPGHLLDDCVESLLAQDYGNFEAIFVDDASTDGSAAQVPTDDSRVTLIRNDERAGGALSAHRVVTARCEPDDIVVLLAGDDRLACSDALTHLSSVYDEHDCQIAYGQSQSADGRYGRAKPIPDEDAFGRLLEAWPIAHVCSYRAGLHQRLAERDAGGAAWPASPLDPVALRPLLCLAGFDRVRYSERILCVSHRDEPAGNGGR